MVLRLDSSASAATDVLRAAALGPTSYADGLALQESLVERRARGETGDWLLFPDHPSVLTVGRGASEGSIRATEETLRSLGVDVHHVARGGDVTWHGPGQLVGYGILDLGRRDRDLHRYLRDLEQVLIESLAGFGIAAERVPGRTGVWTEGMKIGSIGVAVRKWVSYHGFALNVAPDLRAFDLIHPCGLRGIHMTSIADRLGAAAPSLEVVRDAVGGMFAARLGYRRIEWMDAEDVNAAAYETAANEVEPHQRSA